MAFNDSERNLLRNAIATHRSALCKEIHGGADNAEVMDLIRTCDALAAQLGDEPEDAPLAIFHVLIPHEVSYQAVVIEARNAKEAARLVRSESAGTYLDDVYDYGHLVEVPVLIKDLATGVVTFVEDDEDEDDE